MNSLGPSFTNIANACANDATKNQMITWCGIYVIDHIRDR